MLKPLYACALVSLFVGSAANAELKPDKVHVADSKKNLSYIRDGLITGGDKSVNEVTVKDIRRASNAGYERIVIDLEGTKSGETVAIPRPPYYQVAVTPDEKRIVFTVWGKPRLSFDSRKVLNAFKGSAVIESVELLPRVEDERWSFVFALRGESPVEVFELGDPVRIIMDIKSASKGSAPKAAPKTAKKAAKSAAKQKKEHEE